MLAEATIIMTRYTLLITCVMRQPVAANSLSKIDYLIQHHCITTATNYSRTD